MCVVQLGRLHPQREQLKRNLSRLHRQQIISATASVPNLLQMFEFAQDDDEGDWILAGEASYHFDIQDELQLLHFADERTDQARVFNLRFYNDGSMFMRYVCL